jgi:flagellar hook protein FlgE
MCSCKTQKLDSNVKVRNDIRSALSYLNESVKISTQNHAYFANDTQRIVTEEDIIATEYDKETGKPTKETKTKRKITQDSYKVVAEEENQSVTNRNGFEVEHNADISKKIDSEVTEESRSDSGMFWKQFGKSFGIIMGFALIFGLLGRYLLEKFRVS